MRVAVSITLTKDERVALQRWARGRRTAARLVLRAKVVLLASAGRLNKEIAAELDTSPNLIGRWRKRFAERRLTGIEQDAPRGGRKPVTRERVARRIIEATTRTRPKNATHWSTRTLAKELRVSRSMVHRIWQINGLKPHLVRTFKVSNDPRFVEKLVDIVGLYLDPPEHAMVLCVDEKSQIQALDRTQPGPAAEEGSLRHDDARLPASRHDDVVRGHGLVGRSLDRRVHAASPPSGVDQVFEVDRSGDAEGVGFAFDCGQLRDAQACQGKGLVETTSPLSHSFYADEQFVAELNRALVSGDYGEAFEAQHVSERETVGERDPVVS